MASKLFVFAIFALFVAATATSPTKHRRRSSFSRACPGSATYNVTFINLLTPRRFGKLIPSSGLVYSPITATGHSNRFSIMTVRGYASKAIEAIAETGDNSILMKALKGNAAVKSYAASSGGTMPGKRTTVTVTVDCKNPFISAVAMIAPSPDWFVQVSNVNMISSYGYTSRFTPARYGYLFAYDAGTDDSRDFTDPSNLDLDMPTKPHKNIAPLVEDDTDRFKGRVVGKYIIRRIK